MIVKRRSYKDLIPVLLCILMLGVVGFFFAINIVPPAAPVPAPATPTPTPTPTPVPPREIDTIDEACSAVDVYLYNLAESPQSKRLLAEYKGNMWSSISCVVVVDYSQNRKHVYSERDYESWDVKEYIIQHIFDSEFELGTEMLQQVLKSGSCFHGCGPTGETTYPVTWVIDRQTGTVTPDDGNALRVGTELMKGASTPTPIPPAPSPFVNVNMPTGSSTGKVNQTLTFSTSAETNIAGDLEYQFDWGDGSYSSWSSSPSASHSWLSDGTYMVKAQARLVTGTLTSGWSPDRTVNIAAETFRLSTSVSPPGSGTVNPSSGSYDSSTGVTLTTMPASDYYEFDYWSGDASGTSQTITITMDSNKSVVANFKKRYQPIQYTMPPGAIGGSTVTYSKTLKAGETVDGSVQLTGQYYSVDWSYNWTFQILGPGGESIQQWPGHWVNNNYHEFSFTASYAGTYKIRVYHASSYSKNLTIEIWPPGWGYSGS